jgi:PP-loop superfamily ATP-utilizing enzyme
MKTQPARPGSACGGASAAWSGGADSGTVAELVEDSEVRDSGDRSTLAAVSSSALHPG